MQSNQSFSATPMQVDGLQQLPTSTTYTTTTYSQPAPLFNAQPGTYTTQQPLAQQQFPQPSTFNNVPALLPTNTYTGTNTMIPANAGFQQPGLGPNTQLGNTNVSELELKKRILDNNREVQLKYADKETDLQKKFEDKAEKHREKAAKWKVKNMNGFANRHEKKSVKLEMKAHTHYMKAEDYKAMAKNIERERKQYDPPQEKKDDKKTTAKKSDDKKVDDKDKKIEENKPAVETKKGSISPAKTSPAPVHTQKQSSPIDSSRPKKAVVQEKPDYDARYQQDVSTAALRYANADGNKAQQEQMALQQQLGATNLGVPRS